MTIMKPGRATVLIDGQWGSTGKGLYAAQIALTESIDFATTNASANAGHTTVMGDRKFVCYHLPTSAVVDDSVKAYLNAGSIIDVGVLLREIEEVGMDPDRLYIHPFAAVITDIDRAAEKMVSSGETKIASTQKGVGAALARKIRRIGPVARDVPELQRFLQAVDLNSHLRRGARVLVEVPQGMGLGLHTSGSWPHCTSREVSAAQGLSDAQIDPRFYGGAAMTLRTFPIRVGNIVAENGKEIGNSGPHYPDQRELSWKELGQEPELTTVTKRVRRVFSWSKMQTSHTLGINNPSHVFLNFCNYLHTREQLEERIHDIRKHTLAPIWFGFGPDVADIVTDEGAAMMRLADRAEAAQ